MTPAEDGGYEAAESDVDALAEQLSRSSIHDPVGHLLVRLDAAQGYDRLPQPTLPPEVLERVVRHIQPDVLIGDPIAHVTLVRLSCVSRLMRHWALAALYSIIILPRHVREFRKWYSRSVKSQPAYQFAGYTRALFSGLDDVSRLTSFSAGWDHELLRLLHYCGPTLTHLSLWRSESMALLRDPGQVREGYRFGTSQPVQVWGEKEADAEPGVVDDQDADVVAPPEAAHADDLFSKEELDDMPGWLQAEIRLQGTRAVTIRHKAHLTPTRRIARRQQGCQPTHLSIMMSLPLLEHEDTKVFPRMLIWHRVEELDVHIATPGQTPKILRLLASLRESPIRRLRISTSFSSLCMMTPPFPPSKREQQARENGEDFGTHDQKGNFFAEAPHGSTEPTRNLCDALTSILRDEVLRGVLIDELQGKPHTAVPHLEHLMLRCCLDGPNRQWISKPDCAQGAAPSTPASASAVDTHARSSSQPAWAAGRSSHFRLTITRGNQATWAKLKDRLWDFRQRAEGLSEGSWELLS